MKMEQILAAIRTLACSQGAYGRLYRDLMELRANDAEQYSAVVEGFEAQNFSGMLDMVLFIEG